MTSGHLRHEASLDGAIHTLTMDKQPGNVVDIALCRELLDALERAAAAPEARVLVLRGAGRSFCFGASIAEHLPEEAPAMLRAIGAVVRLLVGFPYPTVAGVQGRCLGGGLDLALSCGIVIAEEDAILGVPEIRLGVFPPPVTALLAGRAAEDVILTGRDLTADEAQRLGIVNRVVAKGTLDEAIAEYTLAYFVPRSAASLRVATKAVRAGRREEVERRLAEAEALYVDELLALRDGSEGIRAFIEKRPPEWSHS
ncbi:MAG: enoyl-CoA hydratase-related protein [Actinomycetota bacterium]|jgi:cyclohexa-1,5-dienecarbonyl-CoA hydratase|nr:enoyl-CoA hydratase-related protein [Actinomycetota bacterium]